jgi:hypothetical protein
MEDYFKGQYSLQCSLHTYLFDQNLCPTPPFSVSISNFHVLLTLLSWRWRKQIPPKCWLWATKWHSIISQKTIMFTVAAVTTSDLLYCEIFSHCTSMNLFTYSAQNLLPTATPSLEQQSTLVTTMPSSCCLFCRCAGTQKQDWMVTTNQEENCQHNASLLLLLISLPFHVSWWAESIQFFSFPIIFRSEFLTCSKVWLQ